MYSPETRQSIIFHEDVSSYTINIALNSDSSYVGGDLVAILNGEKVVVERFGFFCFFVFCFY